VDKSVVHGRALGRRLRRNVHHRHLTTLLVMRQLCHLPRRARVPLTVLVPAQMPDQMTASGNRCMTNRRQDARATTTALQAVTTWFRTFRGVGTHPPTRQRLAPI